MPASEGEWKDAKKVLAWEAKLPHGAAIVITATGNNIYTAPPCMVRNIRWGRIAQV